MASAVAPHDKFCPIWVMAGVPDSSSAEIHKPQKMPNNCHRAQRHESLASQGTAPPRIGSTESPPRQNQKIQPGRPKNAVFYLCANSARSTGRGYSSSPRQCQESTGYIAPPTKPPACICEKKASSHKQICNQRSEETQSASQMLIITSLTMPRPTMACADMGRPGEAWTAASCSAGFGFNWTWVLRTLPWTATSRTNGAFSSAYPGRAVGEATVNSRSECKAAPTARNLTSLYTLRSHESAPPLFSQGQDLRQPLMIEHCPKNRKACS